jgi:multicomponent Na+:H+ antiporter subunit G
MIIIEIIAVVSISLGLVFFVAGTLGLLRFTDDLSRLHALTKADNLGLGFVLLGLTLLFFNAALLMKLFIIWALVIISAATVSHAIGQRAYHQLSQQEEVDDDHH